MKVLVRLPNWLGDLVMSSAFIYEIKRICPDCIVDVIVKEEIKDVARHIDGIEKIYPFSKKRYHGLKGVIRFAREIASNSPYDLFFTLPNSFSSALIGLFCGAKERIGYAAQMRSFLLTKSILKPKNKHRVDEYLFLLSTYFKMAPVTGEVHIASTGLDKNQTVSAVSMKKDRSILLNINSEAASRRMPQKLTLSLINFLVKEKGFRVYLSGSAKEKYRTDEIENLIQDREHVFNLAGKTSIDELVQICNSVDLVISTDSGIAHLANALSKPVIVLFGAGNETNTAPYNKKELEIIRVPGVPCAPCVSNSCKFGHLRCMNEINLDLIRNRFENLIYQL